MVRLVYPDPQALKPVKHYRGLLGYTLRAGLLNDDIGVAVDMFIPMF